MSVIKEIIDNIEIKPNNIKKIITWIVSISITLISFAFLTGKIITNYINKTNNFEKSFLKIENEMKIGFDNLNSRIDKLYIDGYVIFDNYQNFNKEQLKMIIDFNGQNNELLKRMLEINEMQNKLNVQSQIELSKIPIEQSPSVVIENKQSYPQITIMVKKNTTDSTFSAVGVDLNYIRYIEQRGYLVLSKESFKDNQYLYSIIYKNR